MSWLVIGLFCGAVGLLAHALARVVGASSPGRAHPVERAFTAEGLSGVRIESPMGPVSIRTGVGNEVRVGWQGGRATVAGASAEGLSPVESERRGDTLLVRRTGVGRHAGPLVVVVPPGMAVDVEAGMGSISVEGRLGEIGVELGNGSLVLDNVECAGKNLHAHVALGSLSARLKSLPHASVHLVCDTGSAELAMPTNAAASVSLRTRIGSIQADSDVQVARRTASAAAVYQLNGGGVGVDLEVGVGNIHVRRTGHQPVSTLLRPAQAPADLLLRPAQTTGVSDPAVLLRAAEQDVPDGLVAADGAGPAPLSANRG